MRCRSPRCTAWATGSSTLTDAPHTPALPGLRSNRDMNATDRTDQRLTELEIKLSYADDLLDTLNRQVAQQQQAIDLLMNEVHRLRQNQAESDTPGFRSLRDELPPHY